MIKASYPFDEICRLEALAEYKDVSLNDLPSLDHIVELAAKLFDVPMAFISLIREDTQVFHAKVGIHEGETSRDISFCSHTVLSNDLLVVLDALYDYRFHDNPLTVNSPHIRFYVGMPLRSPDGYPIGTLCLADKLPRNSFSDKDMNTLSELAKIAMDAMEMHRLEIARKVGQRRFEGIANNSPDCILCADSNGLVTYWNPAAQKIYGYTPAEMIGKSIEFLLPPHRRGHHAINLAISAHGQNPQQVGKTMELITLCKDGSEVIAELSLSMWFENGHIAFGAILRDIRERQSAEEKLFKMAHLDSLTGLPNRVVLKNRLDEHVSKKDQFGLMLIDLDNFKEVNDTSGHPAGDEILKLAAQRLLSMVRATDTICRLGGDEFAIIFLNVKDERAVNDRAHYIVEALQQPYTCNHQVFNLGGSIGIATFPLDAATTDELVSNADMALYQAKVDGKNRWHRFSPVLRAQAIENRKLRTELADAVRSQQFEMYYQPQVLLHDGTLMGAEALIRWNHPTRGVLSPVHFLSELENSRDALIIASWILDQACQQASLWRRSNAGFRVAVNVFSKQLDSVYFYTQVKEALDKHRLAPDGLEIEVTENICLVENENIQKNLVRLFELGVGIAFDDYGTGFASLSVLKNFPLTKIKIDRSFVTSMQSSETDAVIVRSIIQLGKGLGYSVIAEGIETESEAQRLMSKGCTEGQGYLFGYPMPAGDFEGRFVAVQADH